MKTRTKLIKKSVGIKFHDMGELSGSFDVEISESVSLKVVREALKAVWMLFLNYLLSCHLPLTLLLQLYNF